jgi:hypothetical protein
VSDESKRPTDAALFSFVKEALVWVLALLVVSTCGGVSPLFTSRYVYLGFPLAALYALIAVGETYRRLRKYRFRRRVRCFEEKQARD